MLSVPLPRFDRKFFPIFAVNACGQTGVCVRLNFEWFLVFYSNGLVMFLFFARFTVQMSAITNQVPIKHTFSWNVFVRYMFNVHQKLKAPNSR